MIGAHRRSCPPTFDFFGTDDPTWETFYDHSLRGFFSDPSAEVVLFDKGRYHYGNFYDHQRKVAPGC